MAKLFATEVASCLTSKANIVFGGYGYMMEYPVQRYFHDARFLLYGEGTLDAPGHYCQGIGTVNTYSAGEERV